MSIDCVSSIVNILSEILVFVWFSLLTMRGRKNGRSEGTSIGLQVGRPPGQP